MSPGERWGGHVVLESLGTVGIAEQYRVRGPDGRVRRLDVVAVQHPQLAGRLRDAVASRVEHPNLERLEAVIEVLRFPGLLSEDSDGQTLEAWLREPRTLEQRLAVFRGLVLGVAALHARALPHGDLNPESVRVERSGHARVCLPGVMATVLALLREGETVTTSGAALGKPAYLSPEQARRPEVGDLRSDRFSLGCLLYLLLAGRGPFDGLDRYECWDAARSGRVPPLEGVDPDLAGVARELLAADPNARPTLDVVLARLPDVPSPPAPSPPAPSRTVPVAVGAAVVLVLAAVGAWWLW